MVEAVTADDMATQAARVAIISTSFTPKYPRYMNILLMQLSACPALCHHEEPYNINACKIVY